MYRSKIKTLQIIHFAICAGVLIAYALKGNLSASVFTTPTINTNNIFYALIPLIAVLVSNMVFQLQLKSISKETTDNNKFANYQTASIMRWAILEGAAFFLLFVSPDLLVFGFLTILYLLFLRPTEEKVTKDLT